MDITIENKLKIQSNRRDIFELETLINANKAKAYATRSTIEQNYNSIMRNYSAAFMGNHNLTNQNSDDIFRNRVTILTNMEVNGSVEINFRESMTNQANIDFLEMRASVNKMVVEVNNRMSVINEMLIETNKMIMKANEESVKFNSENLEVNERFLNGEFHPSKATVSANRERINQNTSRCKKIRKIATKNEKKLAELLEKARQNSINVLHNSSDISKRREVISDNQKAIIDNQNKVAEMITNQ